MGSYMNKYFDGNQQQRLCCNLYMTIRKGPNPWLLVGLTVSSFAAFFFIVKQRENSNPASFRPRQADHPLIPPRRKE